MHGLVLVLINGAMPNVKNRTDPWLHPKVHRCGGTAGKGKCPTQIQGLCLGKPQHRSYGGLISLDRAISYHRMFALAPWSAAGTVAYS